MKSRSTTPVSVPFHKRAMLVAASVLMVASTPLAFTNPAKADKYDAQIAALQREINQYNSEASRLANKRQGFETKLAQLNNEKAQIQAQIDITVAKLNKLKKEIAENQAKIDSNQEALGDIIADLYVGGSISPLEMIASSKNIGDYLDKTTYQQSIRDTLKSTIDTIKRLKKKLEEQKKSVEHVLGEQKLARKALAKKEAEQAQLIRQTRGKEAAFQNLSKKARAEKAELQRQQQAAIEARMRAAGGSAYVNTGGSGGYPWAAGCYVGADAMSRGGPNGNGTDPLGYGCRQCVSYTAWKVGQRTGNYPRYWGNANMWPNSARVSGYRTGSQPRANSVGVISAGMYGHVVWVHSVSGGMVNISQYNYNDGSGWGKYSTATVPASTYDTYIYF